MDNRKPYSWMVKPKGLIHLIGAEYDLMVKAGGNVLIKFYLSSLLIVVILVLSFFSIRYAMDLMFHVPLVGLLFSIFFSTLFVFIYIFLINTFTKKHLSVQNQLLQLSNLIRLGFVLFMAFMISKPIEIYLFSMVLKPEVEQYKSEILHEHQRKVDAMFREDLYRLNEKIAFYKSITYSTPQDPEQEKVILKIQEIEHKKNLLVQTAQIRVEQSSFFVFQIKQLIRHHPFSFIITFIIIGLFLAPGFIIYHISKDDAYYRLKSEYENNIILSAYSNFNQGYKEISFKKFGYAIEFYTVFDDPPFNSRRKSEATYQPESDFFKKYSQAV